MKTYHIGLIKGSGKCYPLHRNGHRKTTLVLQARRCIDYLSPSLWLYMGERIITKCQLRANVSQILGAVNKSEGTAYTTLIVD